MPGGDVVACLDCGIDYVCREPNFVIYFLVVQQTIELVHHHVFEIVHNVYRSGKRSSVQPADNAALDQLGLVPVRPAAVHQFQHRILPIERMCAKRERRRQRQRRACALQHAVEQRFGVERVAVYVLRVHHRYGQLRGRVSICMDAP